MQSATAIPARFLSILDFDHEALSACLARAGQYKAARATGVRHDRPLDGRHVALLFEKPSLRTRSTFEIAVHELGGQVIEPPTDVALGGRESIADVARNLERWVYAAVVRTYAQDRLAEFAAAAPRLRVLNALTNEEHPCQALADCLTLVEAWGSLRGRTVAFVGDCNNVATSLAHRRRGCYVRVASPKVSTARLVVAACPHRGSRSLECVTDPVSGVAMRTVYRISDVMEKALGRRAGRRLGRTGHASLMATRGRRRSSCTACRASRAGSDRRRDDSPRRSCRPGRKPLHGRRRCSPAARR